MFEKGDQLSLPTAALPAEKRTHGLREKRESNASKLRVGSYDARVEGKKYSSRR
jgi:hypothetical protein